MHRMLLISASLDSYLNSEENVRKGTFFHIGGTGMDLPDGNWYNTTIGGSIYESNHSSIVSIY